MRAFTRISRHSFQHSDSVPNDGFDVSTHHAFDCGMLTGGHGKQRSLIIDIDKQRLLERTGELRKADF